MKKIIISFTLSILVANFNVQAQVQKMYVDTKTNVVERQSTYISNITFIPLQLPKYVEINKYDFLMIHKNYFIFDQSTSKSILFFSKEGKFIKKISYKNLGDGFSPVFNRAENLIKFFGNNKHYTLTQRDRVIVDENYKKSRYKKYFRKYVIDLSDTSLLLKRTIPNTNDISITYKIFDDYYIRSKCQVSSLFKDSIAYELLFYQGDSLIGNFFLYNHKNEPKFLYNSQILSVICNNARTPNDKYISRYFCDTIYLLNKIGIEPAFEVVLPLENKLPNSFFTTPFKNKTERGNFEQNNGNLLSIPFVILDRPSFIILGIAFINDYNIFLYDKKNKKTFLINNIKPDGVLDFNIPVLNQFDDNFFEEKMYSLLLADDIKNNFKQIKQTPIPLTLDSIVHGRTTNPIIAVITLKN